MYLIDMNIFLEILLAQEQKDIIQRKSAQWNEKKY